MLVLEILIIMCRLCRDGHQPSDTSLIKNEMSPRPKKKQKFVTLHLANVFTKTAEQVGTGGGLAPHFFQNR